MPYAVFFALSLVIGYLIGRLKRQPAGLILCAGLVFTFAFFLFSPLSAFLCRANLLVDSFFSVEVFPFF